MESAPYDNVEFPIRRPPGTGTWPGPGHIVMSVKSPSPKVSKTKKEPKLSPVFEGDGTEILEEHAEMPEIEEQRQQIQVTPQTTKQETEITLNKGVHVVNSKQTTNNNISSAHNAVPKTMTSSAPGTPKDARPGFTIVEQPRPLNKEFSAMDLNPSSQLALAKAYTYTPKFYKLNNAMLEQADSMKQEIWDVKGKPGETVTYEQLLQGMLEEGEMLLLGGSWLHFSHLDFYDTEGKEKIKPSIGKGRLCLTNQRLLILSAENNVDADFSEFGEPTAQSGGYKLELSKCNSAYYQNIPLGCLLNVELSSMVGQAQESKLTMVKPICGGLCSCFGVSRCSKTWKASHPMPIVIRRRVLRIGISMPPWQIHTLVVVHLSPEMPLTGARDFIAEIQHHAPLLH